jgi:hypothetical protein
MRTWITRTATVALALTAAPALAHAQETEQEAPEAADRTAMFEKLDRDSDGTIDEAEFHAFESWLAEHRANMIAHPARHAMMMDAWQDRMGEHHAEGMQGEPMMHDGENWKSSMDVTKTDDFVGSYWRLFDRDRDESITRDEWDEAFDVLYPDVRGEAQAQGAVDRRTDW